MDLSKGNLDSGAKIFKSKCLACHTSNEGGPNRQGPNLFKVVGRKAGEVPNFKYTSANKNSGIVWTKENLFEYLLNPKKYIKGTSMAFPGLKKESDRLDIISYLNSLQ